MIRAVIFDVGNTLLYFDGDWNAVTQRGTADMITFLISSGLTIGEDFADDFVRIRRAGRDRSARTDVEFTATQALTEALEIHGNKLVPAGTIQQALAVFFRPEQDRWVAYPDADRGLARLQSDGLMLGAISNATDDPFVRVILSQAGLDRYLHPIITSAGMPWRKPDPRIFQYVLQHWKLEPSEAIMVGDWPSTDVLGAHRAGMPSILIDERWPEAPHLDTEVEDEERLAPDAVILQLDELPQVIRQLNESRVIR